MNSSKELSAASKTVSQGFSDELLNWSKEDRFKLLTALKTHHSSNIEDLSKGIKNKTREEVQQAVDWYKSRAFNTLKYSADKVYRRLRKKKIQEQIPLMQWSKLLLNSFNFEELHTATSTAFRLLAEFEEAPPPESTERVDFAKIRFMISNALEGRPLPDVDEFTQYVFNKCLIEAALKSKGFIPQAELQSFLTAPNHVRSHIKLEENSSPFDAFLVNLHYLAIQQAYNPLNIPERYLKSIEEGDAFPALVTDYEYHV
ncbi:hypothetical protein EVAR_11471_1 [Eumeta japonica]|uniref:Uncharacterized protein n=1 Tax=Eumeta variegata TaxID=151549 RepID=A0A4C1TNF1_EUMVA|nr:hypothetical protein EVAR_11471_1 [Eumeta japonica]